MGVIKPAYSCMLTMAMDVVGGKWKMVILWHLRQGKLRFTQVKALLPGITQKMLTQQLRELEEAGLVIRTVYPVVPPKVEYRLAAEGEALIPALEVLRHWSVKYASNHNITCAVCPKSE